MRNFAVATLVAVAFAKPLERDLDFVGFIAKHGKSYETIEEYNLRFENYKQIDEQIRHFNLSERSSRHGHNFMSDFTREEYRARLGLKNIGKPDLSSVPEFTAQGNVTIPASVDWRN